MINQFNKLSVDARIVGFKQITKAAASAKTPDTFIKMMVGIALVGSVMVLSLLLGEHLGGWKANGLFERRIFLIYFFWRDVFSGRATEGRNIGPCRIFQEQR